MKKIILLVLILLSTGCYEESGKLVTNCVKKENMNTLYRETTYSINFKENIINEVIVTNYYKDSNINTVSSIKSSIISTDKFITGLRENIEIDNEEEFKISYTINLNDSKEILNKFEIKETRSDLIKLLEEKGFECN